MTQWYSCNASEAMNGKGYIATRCMPQLEFFDDGAPMVVTVDVLLYGHTTIADVVPQFEIGYYNTDLRQWFISNYANEHGFIAIAWCYLPDVPSIYEDAVKLYKHKSEVVQRPNAEKSPDLVTRLNTNTGFIEFWHRDAE